ncbi:MAG: peptidase M15 [Microviridae sp.]|nr:MAG: peptidase M15 [Microviridae sp.]
MTFNAQKVWYKRHLDFPPDLWRWPSFFAVEIACRGSRELLIDFEAMDALQALRDEIGAPLVINSAFRTPEHNLSVNGALTSLHLRGQAFDIRTKGHSVSRLAALAVRVGFRGIGYYPHLGFIHLDIGPPRSWGAPIPKL